MKTTLYTCELCGSKRSSLHRIGDFRGNTIGLVGDCCKDKAENLVDALGRKYGAYIVDGRYQNGPAHSPDITSFAQLTEELRPK